MSDAARPCPACGAHAVRARSVAPERRSIAGGALELLHCRCGASFQPDVPGTDELARWYDYMGRDPINVETSPVLDRRLGRMVDGFSAYRRTGRLLDVGCGGGLFVRAAMARGWDVWGTEISPSCIAVLRPLLRDKVHEGSVERAPFADASFDGAALIEVVEHLADPLPYLRAIHRLLRPGGRLFATTPNLRGVSGRLLGTKWTAYDPEHLSYFDAGALATLLRRANFADVRISTSNFDLLALSAPLRRRLQRLRRATPAATDATVAPPSTPAPVALADRPFNLAVPPSVVDLAIEAANRIAQATRMGDTLRVSARRP